MAEQRAASVPGMAEKRTLKQQYPPRLRGLIAQGAARPAQRQLSDVLATIGPRQGPITYAGTRALQEQRGDVV
jgi:hypothetical protein